jgi:ATP-dependent helicase/nuclease subunit A
MVMEKNGTFRPMKYGDIVILLRSIAGKGPQLMKVLEENHIPAVSDKEEDFMENGEVEILWALLKILDNPRQDLALAAVLRSYFVGLDEKDLVLLYLEKADQGETDLWSVLPSTVLSEEKEKKLRRFLTLYRDWRKNAMRDGTAPLLRRILGDTDYLTYVSGLSGGAWRAGHILSFYHLALERDSAPKSGLYSFLNYLSQLKKEKKSFKAQTVSSIPDSVHIMTIHKSKGLEFPVVFLADAQKEFNLRDTWQTAICHKDLGLGIQYYDKKNKVRWPSLYWYALREASRRENMAEEARLLYVAMTRARDKLFITAIKKDAAAELDRWTTSLASAGMSEELSPLPAHLIANAKSFLDWIMPAALHHRTMKEAWDRSGKIPSYRNDAPSDHSLFTFSITSQTDLLTEEEKEALDMKGTEEILPSPKEENREEKTELSHFLQTLPEKAPGWMDAQLSWTYGHRGALETPAKLTATAAVHLRELAEYKESDEPPLPSVILAQDGDDALDADYAAPPLFLSGDETKYQGTSFGTLMHRAMEMIDFTTLPAEETAIKAALRGLVEKKVFTEEEGHILLSGKRNPTPVFSLLTFARSPLAEKMKTASAIRKEMPFSILLPARSFYPECEEGENIFLQGVMDCLLEYEKDFIIIDYKTDRTMTEEELKSHYKIQLQVYGEAAEKLLGKPVSHLYLWSFTYGKAIEVEKM